MKSEKLLPLIVLLCVVGGCAHQKKQITASRSSAHALYDLALIEIQEASTQGRFALLRALALLEQACAKHSCIEWNAQRASLLMRLGRHQQAADCLQLLIDQEKNRARHALLLNNYACVLVELKQPERALELWGQLVNNVNYTTPECAWYNSGKLYLMQENKKQAYDCFVQALTISPSYVEPHRALAQLMDEFGENEQAGWHRMVAQHMSLEKKRV